MADSKNCLGVLSLLLIYLGICTSENLIRNGDFEEAIGSDDWFCHGQCSIERTPGYSGEFSARVFNRSQISSNLRQKFLPVAGKNYFFTAMVRLEALSDNAIYHNFMVFTKVDYKNGESVNDDIAVMPYMIPEHGWTNITSVIQIPDLGDVKRANLYLRVKSSDVAFYVDDVSLTELTPNVNWKEEANTRIRELRQSQITLRVTLPEEYDPAEISVELKQMTHDFPFGSVVKADAMMGSDAASQKYREYLYDMFNMAVLSDAIKWRSMEKHEGDINFWRVDRVLEELEYNNMSVKGHCIMWGMEDRAPQWLVGMSAPEIEYHVTRRLAYLSTHYSNRFIHWDVNNEQLHGSFYEDTTGEVNILAQMLKEVNLLDPASKLFLNDFSLVSEDSYTMAMVDSVRRLQQEEAPVYGIGVQSHFRRASQWDPDLVAGRLALLQTANVPIWISELDVNETNVELRAQIYEDILHLYFSHPAVEGIVLWGYWDRNHWRPHAALVEGEELVENAAGKAVRRLWKEEWRTHAHIQPESHNHVVTTRGFHGEYSLTVSRNGTVIKEEEFHVSKGIQAYIYVDL